MAVTAKAKLASVTLFGENCQLKFQADYAHGKNKEWAAATPSLGLDMIVKNEVYENNFELGKSYDIVIKESD